VYLTIVTLIPESDGISPPEPSVLRDLILDLATSLVDLQHVRVSVRTDEIDIALFCGAASVGAADAAAVALCQTACEVSPVLCGWRVRSPRCLS
jgi:hypothetical protein